MRSALKLCRSTDSFWLPYAKNLLFLDPQVIMNVIMYAGNVYLIRWIKVDLLKNQ